MNKKLAHFVSISLALILCMVLAMPTLAINGSSEAVKTYIEVPVYLIMDDDANVPQTTINLDVATATPPDVESNDFQISAGIMAGVQAGNSVVFDEDQATTPSEDGKPGNSVDKKYATQNFRVDFSKVEFTEPGVYRYEITESAPDEGLPAGVTLASPATKYIDVYVERLPGANDLTIQGIFLLNSNDTIKATDSTGSGSYADPLAKGSGFENFYGTYNLTVKKVVSGNQASRNKYFQVTVTIIGGANTDSYKVVTDSQYETNPDNLTVSGVASSEVFWLKHGESITVQGLPSGAQYMVMENPDGYTATYEVKEGDATLVETKSGSAYTNYEGLNGDTTVTFDNHRAGTVPTGILLTVAPFAVLMLVGVVGVALIIKKKSKSM